MIETAIYTDTGGRAQNEDTVYLVQPDADSLCAIVADGLGGHGGGAMASKTAAAVISGNWHGEADSTSLEQAVQKAHLAVLQQQTRLCRMKSTVAALTIRDGCVAWAHVGDSRLYRFQDGRLEFQTKDHSASQIAVLLGDITVDQIRSHEDRARILRALGQEGELKVDTGYMALPAGQTAFLLCSDGFWEYVLEREMEEDLQQAQTPAQWLERMRQRLLERVPEDNDNNTAAAVWVRRN